MPPIVPNGWGLCSTSVESLVAMNAFSRNSCEVKAYFLGSDVKQEFCSTLLPCTAVYEGNKPTRYTVFHLFAIDQRFFRTAIYREHNETA